MFAFTRVTLCEPWNSSGLSNSISRFFNRTVDEDPARFIDSSSTALIELQDNLPASTTTTNNFVPFPPVLRLHLLPSNALIRPRQSRQNLSRPNYNGYNDSYNSYNNQSRLQHRFQGPPRYQGPLQRFQGPPRYQSPRFLRDPNAFCSFCQIPGHHISQCVSKTRSNNGPSSPPGHQARIIRSLMITTTTHQFIYDTACTDHMTEHSNYFQSYQELPSPRPVTGINGNLMALGHGTVALIDNNNHIHELHKVMFVDQLDEFIISKHWTKKQGLKTSLDENEEFILSSSSGFSIKTSTIHRLSVFTNVRALDHDE
jgi:hypothetical protein